jgi:hypothetical protein
MSGFPPAGAGDLERGPAENAPDTTLPDCTEPLRSVYLFGKTVPKVRVARPPESGR